MQTMLLPAGQVVRHARDFFDLAAVVTVQRQVNKRQRPGDLMVNSSNECSDGIFTSETAKKSISQICRIVRRSPERPPLATFTFI